MTQTNKETGHEGQGRRHPVDPNRHHRENGWDYKGRAIYHFTLPVEERYPLFGTLEGDSAETAHVRLNPFGYQVLQMLCNLPAFYAEKGFALKVLAQKVMPDHLHLVIQVLEPLPKSIGTVVRGFKAACTKLYKQEYFPMPSVHFSGVLAAGDSQGPPLCTNESTEAPVHFSGVFAADEPQKPPVKTNKQTEIFVHFARIFAGRGSIWQQDPAYYHERILHAPGQLRRMIDYVKDNPRRLWLKTHNPDLFKIHRRTEVKGMAFTSLGNHFLLGWPDRQMVEMSRSATEEQVQERLMSVLTAAHNGAVTYTAAISKGEQHIARTVREQGYPLVVLLNDGFPEEGTPKERFSNQAAPILKHVRKDNCCCWSLKNKPMLPLQSKKPPKKHSATRQRPSIMTTLRFLQHPNVIVLSPLMR